MFQQVKGRPEKALISKMRAAPIDVAGLLARGQADCEGCYSSTHETTIEGCYGLAEPPESRAVLQDIW